MRVDRIISDLGLAGAAGEVGDVFRSRLEEEAERFLRAGGTLAWSEWCLLDEVTREAFRVAGDRVRWEAAAISGASAGAPQVARAILAGVEVADVLVRDALAATMAEISAGKEGQA